MGPVCTLMVGRLDDSLKHGAHNPDMNRTRSSARNTLSAAQLLIL